MGGVRRPRELGASGPSAPCAPNPSPPGAHFKHRPQPPPLPQPGGRMTRRNLAVSRIYSSAFQGKELGRGLRGLPGPALTPAPARRLPPTRSQPPLPPTVQGLPGPMRRRPNGASERGQGLGRAAWTAGGPHRLGGPPPPRRAAVAARGSQQGPDTGTGGLCGPWLSAQGAARPHLGLPGGRARRTAPAAVPQCRPHLPCTPQGGAGLSDVPTVPSAGCQPPEAAPSRAQVPGRGVTGMRQAAGWPQRQLRACCY